MPLPQPSIPAVRDTPVRVFARQVDPVAAVATPQRRRENRFLAAMLKLRDLTRSISWRLTVWYAGLLLLALLACYFVSYILVSSLALGKIDDALETEAQECTLIHAKLGLPAVIEHARHEAQIEGTQDLLFKILDSTGNVTFQTDDSKWDSLKIDLSKIPGNAGSVLLSSSLRGSTRETRLVVQRLAPNVILVVAASTHDEVALIAESMRLVLGVMLLVWLATAIIGFMLARRGLRGIGDVKQAAMDFAAGAIDRRARRTNRGDEVDLLARGFNTMAERISKLLNNLRETNDSLAHELRSPVTRIRGRCELALNRGNAELRDVTEETIDQCDRLLGMINTMLEISETEAGVARMNRTDVDLAALLQDACELFEPAADDAGITLTCTTTDTLHVRGDVGKLQRLVSNLLDNALKYTPSGGKVAITAAKVAQSVEIKITDTGVGISPQDLHGIFERFYRGAAGEGRAGNGLGLSLAQTIARAHDGDITVHSTAGEGSTFTVRFPSA